MPEEPNNESPRKSLKEIFEADCSQLNKEVFKLSDLHEICHNNSLSIDEWDSEYEKWKRLHGRIIDFCKYIGFTIGNYCFIPHARIKLYPPYVSEKIFKYLNEEDGWQPKKVVKKIKLSMSQDDSIKLLRLPSYVAEKTWDIYPVILYRICRMFFSDTCSSVSSRRYEESKLAENLIRCYFENITGGLELPIDYKSEFVESELKKYVGDNEPEEMEILKRSIPVGKFNRENVMTDDEWYIFIKSQNKRVEEYKQKIIIS